MRGCVRCRGADANHHVRVGPHGQHVQARIVQRAGEHQVAAPDLQLLAIGGKGAVDRAHAAIDAQLPPGELQAQAGRARRCRCRVRAGAAVRQVHGKRHARAQQARQGRSRRRGRARRFRRRARGASTFIVVERGRVALAEVDQAFVDGDAAIEFETLAVQSQVGLAADHQPAVDPPPSRRKCSATSTASCATGAAPSVAWPRTSSVPSPPRRLRRSMRARSPAGVMSSTPSTSCTPCSTLRRPNA